MSNTRPELSPVSSMAGPDIHPFEVSPREAVHWLSWEGAESSRVLPRWLTIWYDRSGVPAITRTPRVLQREVRPESSFLPDGRHLSAGEEVSKSERPQRSEDERS